MSAFVNYAALAVQEIRSDTLGPLDSIAHPLDPGNYEGVVFRGDAHVGDFQIEVVEGGNGEQVELDFSLFDKNKGPIKLFAGAPKGQKVYAVFHCDGQKKGYRVLLHDVKHEKVRFDSRELGRGDYFIFMPIKPGEYTLGSGKKLQFKGKLLVEQAKPEESPRASSLGAMIQITAKGLNPEEIRVRSGDGVVIAIDTDDVVVVAKLQDKKLPKKETHPASSIRYQGKNNLEGEKRRGRPR